MTAPRAAERTNETRPRLSITLLMIKESPFPVDMRAHLIPCPRTEPRTNSNRSIWSAGEQRGPDVDAGEELSPRESRHLGVPLCEAIELKPRGNVVHVDLHPQLDPE